MTTEHEEIPFSSLVADILTASFGQTRQVTTNLIDLQAHRIETLEAEIDAIRSKIEMLFSGPYMPIPYAVFDALWPSEKTVNAFRRAKVE